MTYPGDIFRDFEKWIDSFETEIINKISFHKYFYSEDMISRAFQIVTQLTSNDYSLSRLNKNFESTSKFGPFVLKNGNLKVSLKSRFLFNGLFFLETGYILLQFINGIFRLNGKQKGKYTVLIEPPIIGNTENLKNFLERTKISDLNDIDHLIIKKQNIPPNDTSKLIFRSIPWNYIIEVNFSTVERILLTLKFTLFIFASFFYLNKSPFNILFYKDFSNSFCVNVLNRRKLLNNIYITNSSYQVQPLWLKGLKKRNFKSHMIWYSQNFIPKFYKGESEQSYLPGTNKIRIDHHWVWTEKFGQMLKRKNVSSNFTAIGSILFYPFDLKINKMKDFILIFDVIPVKSKKKILFGTTYNYYSEETIIAFVNDLVTTVDKINHKFNKQIQIILKTKRQKNKYHSDKYFQFIENLKLKYPTFITVESQMNIYGLINESIAVFSVPFTSTAEVGFEMNTPSFFYDSSNQINTNKEIQHIPILFSKKELEGAILENINSSKKSIVK